MAEEEKLQNKNQEQKPPESHVVAQTFADDMAEALEYNQTGAIKDLIHAEEIHDIEKRNLSPQSKKNRFFSIVGTILILISIGFIAYFALTTKVVPSIPVREQSNPLIFIDKSQIVDITELKKDPLAEKILGLAQITTTKPGGIESLIFTSNKSQVTFQQFINQIEGSFFVDDLTAIDNTYISGIFNHKTEEGALRKDFFILLKVKSMADVFDSFKRWEGSMFFDLHGFFGIPFSPDTKDLISKSFVDGIVENKNARILYDKDGNIALMYVFLNDNAIVITNTVDVVREILSRIASSKVHK